MDEKQILLDKIINKETLKETEVITVPIIWDGNFFYSSLFLYLINDQNHHDIYYTGNNLSSCSWK